jgi:hypothetical protein
MVLLALLTAFSVLVVKSLVVLNNIETSNLPHTSAEDIIVLTPENTTYIIGMNGYFPGTYSFENDAIGIGTIPANWTNLSDLGCYVGVTSHFDHNHALFLSDDEANSNKVVASTSFDPQINGTIELWFRCSEINSRNSPDIRIFQTDVYDGVNIIVKDNEFQSYSGSLFQTITEVISYQWYHIRIDFDCNIEKYRVWIDNILCGTFDFRGSASALSTFRIDTWSSDSSYTYQPQIVEVDAVGFSWDEYYKIGDNSHSGIYVSFTTSISFDSMWCLLDGASYIRLDGNKTIVVREHGIHFIQIFGNESSITYSSVITYFIVLIDSTGPSIVIRSPFPNSMHVFGPPHCDIEIMDPLGVNVVFYRLNNGVTITPWIAWEGYVNETAWNLISDGELILEIHASDNAGNWASASVIIVKGCPICGPIIWITIPALISILIIWLYLRRRNKLQEILKNMNYEDLRGKAVIVNGKKYKNTSLEGLVLQDLGISNIAEIFGIEHVSHLTKLDLASNKLTSFQGLDRLDELEELNVENNEITDLSGIEKLHDLKVLNLNGNEIKDISALSSLGHLERLHLRENGVSSIEPLRNLPYLNSLYVRGNHGIAYSSRDAFFSRIGYVDIKPSPTKVQWSSKTKTRSTEWKPIYGYLIAELIIALVCTFIFVGILDNFLADLNYWDTLFRYFFELFAAGLFIGLVILLIWNGEMG